MKKVIKKGGMKMHNSTLFIILFFLIGVTGNATPPVTPTSSTPRVMINASGTLLDEAHPVPVKITSSTVTLATPGPSGYATDPVRVAITSSTVILATPGPGGNATDPIYTTASNSTFNVSITNTATYPFYVTQGTVVLDSDSVSTYTLVSSSSLTPFSTVCPVATAPCTIWIQPTSKMHVSKVGVASADAQWHSFLDAGDSLFVNLLSTSSWPVQFIGDSTTGPATLAVKIWPNR